MVSILLKRFTVQTGRLYEQEQNIQVCLYKSTWCILFFSYKWRDKLKPTVELWTFFPKKERLYTLLHTYSIIVHKIATRSYYTWTFIMVLFVLLFFLLLSLTMMCKIFPIQRLAFMYSFIQNEYFITTRFIEWEIYVDVYNLFDKMLHLVSFLCVYSISDLRLLALHQSSFFPRLKIAKKTISEVKARMCWNHYDFFSFYLS